MVSRQTSSYSYWLKAVLIEPDCPCDATTGPQLTLITDWANLGHLRISKFEIWSVRGQLGPRKNTLVLWEPLQVISKWTCLSRNHILFCKYLSPLNLHRNGTIFKIFIWISVFRRKKRFVNLFLGCWDIQQTMKYRNYYTFFMRHPLLEIWSIKDNGNIWNSLEI